MISVLKIGGNAQVDMQQVLENLAERVQQGERWVVVHGASGAANALANQMGVPVQTITSPGGHTSRYTNQQMIGIYRAAVTQVNNDIRDILTAEGLSVFQFSSPFVVRARRKTAIRAIRNGRPMVIRDDYSGSITCVDADALLDCLNNGCIPIVAPIALGEEGEALNVDGDLVAANIAHALNADRLIILSNVPGLLRNVEDPDSLITHLSVQNLQQADRVALGRMKKKVMAVAQAEVSHAILADSRIDSPLDAALAGGGTHITGETTYA